MKERLPQISIEREMYDYITLEAKKNHRTIKGQVELMIEMSKTTITESESIHAGNSQLDISAIRPQA